MLCFFRRSSEVNSDSQLFHIKTYQIVPSATEFDEPTHNFVPLLVVSQARHYSPEIIKKAQIMIKELRKSETYDQVQQSNEAEELRLKEPTEVTQ